MCISCWYWALGLFDIGARMWTGKVYRQHSSKVTTLNGGMCRAMGWNWGDHLVWKPGSKPGEAVVQKWEFGKENSDADAGDRDQQDRGG